MKSTKASKINAVKMLNLDSPEPQPSTSKDTKSRSTNDSCSEMEFAQDPKPAVVNQSAQAAQSPTVVMDRIVEDNNHQASIGCDDSGVFEFPAWANSQPKNHPSSQTSVLSSQQSLCDTALLKYDKPSTIKVDCSLKGHYDSEAGIQTSTNTFESSFDSSRARFSAARSNSVESSSSFVPGSPSSHECSSDSGFFDDSATNEYEQELSEIDEFIEKEVLNEELDSRIGSEMNADPSKTIGLQAVTINSQDWREIEEQPASQNSSYKTNIIVSRCLLEIEESQTSIASIPDIVAAEVTEPQPSGSSSGPVASTSQPAPRKTGGRKRKAVSFDDDSDFEPGSDIECKKSTKTEKSKSKEQRRKESNAMAAKNYREKKKKELEESEKNYLMMKAKNEKIRQQIMDIAEKRDDLMEKLYKRGDIVWSVFPDWFLAKLPKT